MRFYYTVVTSISSVKSQNSVNLQTLSKLLESEITESTGSDLIYNKCFRKIERYNATLEELANLKECHRKNVEKWCSENPAIRQKRCTKSPSQGIKIARVESDNNLTDVSRSQIQPRRSLPFEAANNKENVVLSTSTGTNIEVNFVRPCFFAFYFNTRTQLVKLFERLQFVHSVDCIFCKKL